VLANPSAAADSQCLACHRGNRVGGDYHGYFQAQEHAVFRRGVAFGGPGELLYGQVQRRLRPDLHAEAGLLCIDCHSREDVMGDGAVDGFARRRSKVRCAGRHGRPGGEGPEAAIRGVEAAGDGFRFRSRSGAAHSLPRARLGGPGHDPSLHGRVRCSACHARWVFGVYGDEVLRDDRRPRGRRWTRLSRFRRWENLSLGVDHAGRISILRPQGQYVVRYVDGGGRIVVDGRVPSRGDGSGRGWAFEPYTPHTTGRRGRACAACHGSRTAAGLADFPGAGTAEAGSFNLEAASPPAWPGARLLSKTERKRLLAPSEMYGRLLVRLLAPEPCEEKRGASTEGP
jgi:hypothetical protein